MLDMIRDLPARFTSHFFIDGAWTPSRSGRQASIVHPATETLVLDVPLADASDVDNAVGAARQAFDTGPWPRMDGAQRAAVMDRFCSSLERQAAALTHLATAQVGMPVTFAGHLARTGLARYRYYTDLAAAFPFEERRATARGHARVRREPVGVAALISPWNAAFPITAHKLGAALAAGCTCIVKSPVESPLEGLIVATAAAEAGFPAGVVNVVTSDHAESARLVASPGVDKISFTGSVAVGKAIGAAAAERMARVTLELGGKSAAILLDDVDLSVALPALAPFTMPFAGQICFAQTRILAPRARYEETVFAFIRMVGQLRIGDPWGPQIQVGPVLNARQRDRILGFIASGVEQGGRIVAGGGRPEGFDRGFFVEPTVFTDVTPDMTIAREEIFGPVVTIQPYEDEDDAVRIADGTNLGLSGSVYGRDPERAYALACRLRTGQVGINGVELAPSVPFGGYKQSGIGREGGPEGLAAFLETKSVFMPIPSGAHQ